MLYKKSKFGRKYVQLITGSPTIFITFVLIGLGLFLFLTQTTQIHQIKKYSAEVAYTAEGVTLLVKDSDAKITSGLAYVYLNRNEALFPVNIKEADISKDNIILQLDNEGQDLIKSLSVTSIFLDIPQGRVSLLYHIFVNGGKRYE